MAYPKTDPQFVWTAGRIYAVNDVVRASTSSTLAFKCIQAGQAGDAEPIFPNQITKTIEDGPPTDFPDSKPVIWEAFEPLAEELLKLAPTAVIDLFEVELTLEQNGVKDTLRYHAGKNGLTEELKFGQKTYTAVPIEVDGFDFASNGSLPRPTMRVANVNNAITSLILVLRADEGGPLGAKVRRIRTFAKFIDTTNFNQNPPFASEGDVTEIFVTQNNNSFTMQSTRDTADSDAKIVETWYIDRISSENQQFVEFELAPRLDLVNLPLPRRTIEEFCPWQYRGERECPYPKTGGNCFTIDDNLIETGTQADKERLDVCGKRVSSCQARFGTDQDLPFGGFHGARLQA